MYNKSKSANTPVFPQGIRYYAPHENAPDWVKGTIELTRDELLEWLHKQGDKIKLDIKESKEGKMYLAVNDYKPKQNVS